MAEMQYASKGVGTAGLVTGVTSLGILGAGMLGNNNNCGNNGIFGNLFGNNNNCCYETKESATLRTALAISESEKYTSEKTTENLKELYAETLRLNTIQRETDAKIADGLIQTGTALGNLNAKVDCLQIQVDRNREESTRNFVESKSYTDTLVHAEARERKCGDEKTILYVDGKLATKIDGVLGIDGDSIHYGRCKPILEVCPCGQSSTPFNVTEVK